jgi:hypothetical protein
MYPEDPDAIILDPIFRQDKEQLYELIKDFMTPSIIINRPEDDESFNEKVLTKIFNFAKDNHDYHPKTGAGKWHIKGGFSTASRAVTIANSIPEIPARCRQIFKRLGHHSIPYVILQRSFANSVVLCTNTILIAILYLLYSYDIKCFVLTLGTQSCLPFRSIKRNFL